ncbi:MAG TPA: MraY family glycosyltransferase [Verrucomicrobiota bacterium]|jgi:UDP-GlcNAc:undecaprenyl-phosphate GlcNAc-1-phosphate transferase|nr:MraY family glycosyltransferase [Verrucomicrobiota bacterium]HQL78008.1 MraY family glycosyltransferase [Verrucomicrobiota bacterium]
MRFPFNVYLLAVVSACVTVLAALPLWRQWCLRTGLVDDPGHRKIHDQPIPLAGGLAVMTGLLLPTLLACLVLWWHRPGGVAGAVPPADSSGAGNAGPMALLDPDSAFLLQYGLGRRALELAGIFFGALGMLLVGWLDDKHELRPRAKFAGQFLVAALVAASGTRVTLFVPNILFSYAITILWILTVVNAFNFMDNMNGLCAGLGAIGAWHFAMFAAADNQYLVGLIAFLTFGTLLGFLPYNFPRARAFLGDAGSHLVGYLLAVLAILPHFYTMRHPQRWAVVIPLLVLAIPLADLIWVVLLRWHIGQPFYQGDTNHLSHRLVRRGLTPTQAVIVIWAVAEALALLSHLC